MKNVRHMRINTVTGKTACFDTLSAEFRAIDVFIGTLGTVVVVGSDETMPQITLSSFRTAFVTTGPTLKLENVCRGKNRSTASRSSHPH